jgi:probable regulatory domain-containing protein
MSEESSIPLRPIGREEIRKLEVALLLGTLFREDVLEMLKSMEGRLTWVNSLAFAAAAVAREAAKMSVREIADDIGIAEASIRQHLQGKSKAGKLVKETYERFVKEGASINLPFASIKDDVKEKEKVTKEKIDLIINKYEDSIKRLNEDLETLRSLMDELKRLAE